MQDERAAQDEQAAAAEVLESAPESPVTDQSQVPAVDGGDLVAAAYEPEASSPPTVAPVVATPTERDWLSSVCPYLQSVDGPYRSNQPDMEHRCTAQDPAGTVPLAFQERFCLTERHPRCEMYKYVQAVSGSGVGSAGELPGGASPPGNPSVSLRLGSSLGGESSRRPAIIAAAGIAGVAILVFAIVLLLGSCSGEAPGAPADASPEARATGEAAAGSTDRPTPSPAPGVTSEPGPDDADGFPSVGPVPSEILYQVQEGERLLKIAETFGTTRRSILDANEGMRDQTPYVEPGDVIIVPVSPDLSIEEIEAQPGYQGAAG